METKHVDSDYHDSVGRRHDWDVCLFLSIFLMFDADVFRIGLVTRGFVKNFADLFVTRLFLGTAEAGLFPGVSYFLTLWYRR